MEPYIKLSRELTNNLSKIEKKQYGIYFTPPDTVSKTIDILAPYLQNIHTVLEPSCGSCEYILSLHTKYPHLQITGIEYNNTIFKAIQILETVTSIKLYHVDFLTTSDDKKYDLIIGNPPYYVMKKGEVNKSYYPYFDGRPNIFILFLIKSLNLLQPNGFLSFILPKSFLNSIYYNKTRVHICTVCEIIHISECHDQYLETQQETVLFIVKKITAPKNEPFIIDKNKCMILGDSINIKKINDLYRGSTTLSKMGFEVKVGTIVWNEHKSVLTDDSQYTRLVYSSDIKDNSLTMKSYKNDSKKNYIKKKGICEPMLVINRGYGTGTYKFDYCIIHGNEKEYLIENHLIYVKCKRSIDNETLLSMYNKIIRSFEDERTAQFIELYFGNNAINTTELCEMFPIYTDYTL